MAITYAGSTYPSDGNDSRVISNGNQTATWTLDQIGPEAADRVVPLLTILYSNNAESVPPGIYSYSIGGQEVEIQVIAGAELAPGVFLVFALIAAVCPLGDTVDVSITWSGTDVSGASFDGTFTSSYCFYGTDGPYPLDMSLDLDGSLTSQSVDVVAGGLVWSNGEIDPYSVYNDDDGTTSYDVVSSETDKSFGTPNGGNCLLSWAPAGSGSDTSIPLSMMLMML